MFREMRRNRQILSNDDVEAIMQRCSSGTLACMGDESYPYAVPMNFVYFDGKIYLHSAREGHKIDAIQNNPKVSFAVIAEDNIVSAKYTSHYRSVIAFGKARIVDGNERINALLAFTEKYSADRPKEEKVKKATECTEACIIAIEVEQITGKQAREFISI